MQVPGRHSKAELLQELSALRQRVMELARMPASSDHSFMDTIMEHTHVLVAFMDSSFNLLKVNRAFALANNKNPSELVGTSFFDHYPESENRLIFKRVVQSAEPVFCYARHFSPSHCPNPEQQWDWSLMPVMESANKVGGVVLTLIDVSKHAEVEMQLQREKAFIEGLINTAQSIILVLDLHGQIKRINPYLAHLLGTTLDDVKGKNWFDSFIPSYAKKRVKERYCAAITKLQTRGNIDGVLDVKGIEHMIEWYDTTLKDEQGNTTGFLAIGHDVTDRVEAEKNLRLAANILHNTPEGVMVTDADLNIIEVNPAFIKTTGFSREEAIGKNPTLLRSGRHNKSYYNDMWSSIHTKGKWQGEIWNRRKNGEIYPEWLNIVAMPDESGQIRHFVGIFSDVSRQEHLRKRLHYLAYYDDLTGLPNRALFHEHLNMAITQADRTNDTVALLFLDLDRFKNINDSLGHGIGDRLLQVVADQLKLHMRKSDTLARLGGDEFTIILSGIQDHADVARVAEKVIASLVAPIEVENKMLHITASIGISLYPQDGKDADNLLKNADVAMYRAKEKGRNTFMFYSSQLGENFIRRVQLEYDLRVALEKGQFRLYFQPQIDLKTQNIIGVEALIRWQHPEEGLIEPLMFISVAEEIGLIESIGEWVLNSALVQLKSWKNQYDVNIKMAVNVSFAQLRSKNFASRVEAALLKSNIQAKHLEIELTESVLMGGENTTKENFNLLGELGVQLAIDDFGTGYSSLSNLQKLPIDKLKIDRSFVKSIYNTKSNGVIASTVIAMGHGLGIRVLAEGVETERQMLFLEQHGCDELQGFYFSHPKPAVEISQLLNTQRKNTN